MRIQITTNQLIGKQKGIKMRNHQKCIVSALIALGFLTGATNAPANPPTDVLEGPSQVFKRVVEINVDGCEGQMRRKYGHQFKSPSGIYTCEENLSLPKAAVFNSTQEENYIAQDCQVRVHVKPNGWTVVVSGARPSLEDSIGCMRKAFGAEGIEREYSVYYHSL